MVKHERFEGQVTIRRLASGQVAPPEPASLAIWTRFADFIRRRPWFALTVIAPTLVAVLYYGVIASDVYVSEAQFIIRSTNKASTNALGSFLQTVGLVRSQDDTFSVQTFIMSRDAVRQLEERNNLRGVLARQEGDFVNRFPSLFGSDRFEQLYKSYQSFVSVIFDSTTGISTLRVRAFRPDDAQGIATAILEYGETLVNRLNDRARQDSIDVAKREVALSEERVTKAQTALTTYRLRTSMLDPTTASNAALELVSKLSVELAATQAQIAEVAKATPNSPHIASLRNRVAALEGQITEERRKIVGDNDSIALKIAEYERLALERQFADRALASSIGSLETARIEAQHKQLYLERVVEPNLPDYALYPRRLLSIFITLVSCLIVYGIVWLISAGFREHAGR
jgi:capsular polysaccharide transport system permease protein